MSRAPHGDERTIAYLPSLDGVRALAVTAVLVFHGGVAWLPGGFLGVDAFFVLSGFLITSLLLAERQRYGRIRLGAFWLRRARRLLPALLLVLVFVVVAFRDLLPRLELTLLRGDALAALGYVANWRMIYRGDDYFTQTSSPSPLQHTWSLGIEEQFYVVWPLIVVALLAIGLSKARAILVPLCLVGAVASALAAAVLYDPLDVNRAYFGTDTRAQALLVGCALGGLLSTRRGSDGEGPTRVAAVVGVAGVVSVVAVGWLWTQADGTDGWLYRGGFTLGAVAVAVVLAHAVLSPDAPIGRALALPPLVWLGKISYGVYLWHWPVFGLLDAERTGLHGTALLALRLAATLAAALASYVFVERPIRTGRWPVRLPKLAPAAYGAGATAAVGVTGVLVLVATMPATVPTISSIATLPGVATTPRVDGVRVPPMLRPDRRPGTEPRIAFFGDSVSWSLGTYLPAYKGVTVTVRSIAGCGIARLPDIVYIGLPHTNYPPCPTWPAEWRAGVEADDPDVVVILLDRWELMDRRLGKDYMHVGQPEYDAYLTLELELGLSIAMSRGAHVVLLTAPYNRRQERPDGGLYDEDLPERVDAWNRLQVTVAARYPDRISIIDLNARVCPDGEFTWTINRLRIRSDGLHFTPDGVRRWIAPWLMPQVTAVAAGGIYAVVRGD